MGMSGKVRIVECITVLSLLAAYFALAASSGMRKSPVFDEVPHLTAGVSHWRTGDYRLNPEQGALPQRWAALPVAFGPFGFPHTEQEAWRLSDEWELGDQLFHRLGNDLESMLLRARSMVTLLGVLLGLTVYLWSRSLFGRRGAFISLILFCFSPTMLAHGRFVTSDLTLSLTLTVAVGAWWLMLHRLRWYTIVVSAAATGMVFLSKASALVLIPMLLIVTVAQRVCKGRQSQHPTSNVQRPTSKSRGLSLGRWELGVGSWALVCTVVTHLFVVWIMVWAAFGFRSMPGKDWDPARDRYLEPWDGMLADGGAGARVIGALRKTRVLPDAYLWGIANARAHGRSRRAFLAGEYSLKGWRYFFPFAVLVKTPSAVLGMLCCAALAGLYGRGSRVRGSGFRGKWDAVYRVWPLLMLLGVYWAALLSMKLNIGHRHALATYPAMFILAGGAGAWLRRETRVHMAGTVAVVVMLCTMVVGALSTWPHYLAYFNPMAGGSAKGYRLLVDSSLDWGQDLPGLRKWLVENVDTAGPEGQPYQDAGRAGRPRPAAEVYLAYFGKGSPEYYGIEAEDLLAGPPGAGKMPAVRSGSAGFQSVPDAAEARRSPGTLAGGIYCVSATMLQAVHIVPMGRWCRFYEQDYQRLLSSEEARRKEADLFRQLRFGRLAAYLREREPDDYVGYSILIFGLSDEEVKEALHGAPAELFDGHGVAGVNCEF